jgi:hypothetical protein
MFARTRQVLNCSIELGHEVLADEGLRLVSGDFPLTIQLTSEVLESNCRSSYQDYQSLLLKLYVVLRHKKLQLYLLYISVNACVFNFILKNRVYIITFVF